MLSLFQGFGVELEYMIVDRNTLAVRPIADELLRAAAGSGRFVSDFDVAETGISWSNELALHVVELKTTEPAEALQPLPARFAESVGRINGLLAPCSAMLLPSAMHPLMNPPKELRLWPHDNQEIYSAFDRIFGCRGHGWANLQSVHLNLPFAEHDQDSVTGEFARLHAAVRLLLPILPGLAASSPIMDGKPTGVADNRLAVYRTNARRVPSVSGHVIPEPVYTKAAYEGELLGGIYRDLAPLDPGGILRDEWVNARGAIARFSRNTIEIRVLDCQECPAADLALCAAIVGVLQDLVRERWLDLRRQQAWPIAPLEHILVGAIHHAEESLIDDAEYLAGLGYPGRRGTAGEVWAHLVDSCVRPCRQSREWLPTLETILREGTLASRLARAAGPTPASGDLRAIYTRLAGCLAGNTMFVP